MKSTGFVLAVVAAVLVGCGDDNPIGSELGPVHSTGPVMDRLGEQRALCEALGASRTTPTTYGGSAFAPSGRESEPPWWTEPWLEPPTS